MASVSLAKISASVERELSVERERRKEVRSGAASALRPRKFNVSKKYSLRQESAYHAVWQYF